MDCESIIAPAVATRFYETYVFKETSEFEEPQVMTWFVDLERVESFGVNTGDAGGTILIMHSGDAIFMAEPIEEFRRVFEAYRGIK